MAPLVWDAEAGVERRRTLLVVAEAAAAADRVREELRDDWYVVGCRREEVWVAARSIRFDLVLVLGEPPAPGGRDAARLFDAEVGVVPEAIAVAPSADLARWAVETAWARLAAHRSPAS